MRRLIINLSILCVILLIFDFAFGFAISALSAHAESGSTYKHEYIAEDCTADILILGSSRASHHYIPSIISDSLDLSCYNCGEDGNGILLAYPRFSMIAERHNPKLVIYELTPERDYLDNASDSYSHYFGQLKSYYNKPGAKAVIDSFASTEEKLLLHSNMYRYNSRLIPAIIDNFFARYELVDGYMPLTGTFDPGNTDDASNDPADISSETDPIKIEFIRRLLDYCGTNDISVVFTISPCYVQGLSCYTDECFEPAKELACEYNIPILDHRQLEGFEGNAGLFQDEIHLNSNGARLYSEFVAEELVRLYAEGKI